ncbi:MAG: hypothetical protein V4436_02780 [Patescibacteria group bacterium]
MTKKSNAFYMAGTEGTGRYVVIAKTARGRIGVRALGGCLVDQITKLVNARVRVEPVKKSATVTKMADVLSIGGGWKQPGDDGEHRFSTVVEGGGKKLKLRVEKALVALGAGSLVTEVNPDAPAWAKDLVSSLAG